MPAGPPPAGPINPYAAPETPADMASVVGITPHDLTREEVEAFVGDRHAYYWGKWQRAAGGGLRAGFNWAAFFLNVTWMLYRRMYREFFIWIGVVFGLGVVQGVVAYLTEKNLDVLDKVQNIVLAVTMGMIGNGLYLRRARRVIGNARAQEPDPERRAALLRARGGTSWIGLLVAIAAGIAFGVLAAIAR